MRLVFRPSALADLDAIHDFIATDNPVRAFAFVAEIRAGCEVLKAHPLLGRARGDLGVGIRIHVLQGKIVVAYRRVGGDVVIVRIFSGGRDYAAILREGSGEA